MTRVCIAYANVLASPQVYCARHAAVPFGAVASVHAWERVGAALCFLARTLLRIPMLRYVDDFFAPERSSTSLFVFWGMW